jgi:hypothetical protein
MKFLYVARPRVAAFVERTPTDDTNAVEAVEILTNAVGASQLRHLVEAEDGLERTPQPVSIEVQQDKTRKRDPWWLAVRHDMELVQDVRERRVAAPLRAVDVAHDDNKQARIRICPDVEDGASHERSAFLQLRGQFGEERRFPIRRNLVHQGPFRRL